MRYFPQAHHRLVTFIHSSTPPTHSRISICDIHFHIFGCHHLLHFLKVTHLTQRMDTLKPPFNESDKDTDKLSVSPSQLYLLLFLLQSWNDILHGRNYLITNS